MRKHTLFDQLSQCVRNLSLSQVGNSAKKWEGGFHRSHEEEVVAKTVKSRARCTTLEEAGASEKKFTLFFLFFARVFHLFLI